MGTIPGRVDSLESDVAKQSEQINTNKTDITNLQNKTAELAVEISTERGRVNNLELKDISFQQQIDIINATIDPYKNYSDLITGEIENRTLGDERLQQQINTHTDSINNLGQSINNLNAALSAESASRESKDIQIDESIASINNNIGVISSDIDNLEANLQANVNRVDSHQTTITALETNTIKTHIEDVVYVAKIKFLSSIDEYNTLADAGQLDSKTLYLIQEEE
jgi:chromosome segregation ATPase